VLAQSAGFALLAAVSPTALLVMAIFLGSANPRLTALAYVAGAVLMTVVMAVAVLLALRAFGLNQPRQHEPRYALRLALGVAALAVAVFVSRRVRRLPAGDAVAGHPVGPAAGSPAVLADGGRAASSAASGRRAARPGVITRLTTNPRPLTAFLAGLLLFAPSATFIAAVQVIATANEGVPITVAALLIVIALTALIVWLPLLGYFAAPDATTRALRRANGWIRAHGNVLLVGALWIGGVVLVVDGALGLSR
jgi:Sap, sulfolipid-1-addressing protein